METARGDATNGRRGGEGAVLVCGLGSLGTECVSVLRRYGVPVRSIDLAEPRHADVELVRGDCRHPDVLHRAGIESCRAIVLVTGDARANVEAALAARKLNASIRIVARAGQDNINNLLSGLLGNFVAYEPSRLAAGALALAASRGDVLGYFHLQGRLVRVVRRKIEAGSRWCGAAVKRLAHHGLVVLDHAPGEGAPAEGAPAPAEAGDAPAPLGPLFYTHDPEREIKAGDVLTLLTIEGDADAPRAARPPARRTLAEALVTLLRSLRRPGRVIVASLTVITAALVVSAIAFPSGERSLSRVDGVFTALVLMTGGTYADLFPPFNHLSNGLRALSVTLSAIGTVFVGLLYAWLTERVVTWRLRLGTRRPRVPASDHVVVVGLGRVGRQATVMLLELEHTVAAIETGAVEPHSMPQLAIVTGSGSDGEALAAANIAGARAVLAVTHDEWVNLEVALQVRRVNTDCHVVVRTQDTRFSQNIADVVPNMRPLCVPVIAATAFAAAAVGGNVLDLFQLGERTVFVIEHAVQAGDGLDGRFLAEAAEGYAVVPVWYAADGHAPRFWSPTDHAVRLKPGDRLVLLGPSRSLQWIERGEMRPRQVTLRLMARRSYADAIAVASLLVQHTRSTLDEALRLVQGLPQDLPGPLYPHQAQRLKAALEASGTTVELRADGLWGQP
jgi:Trk K+ transport system NAD-binding subunit